MKKQYSTSLDAELIKKIKLLALENDVPANIIIESALVAWLEMYKKDKVTFTWFYGR